MSKDNVKSWDSRMSKEHDRRTECSRHFTGQPVRIVEWDPAWPPQSEVPHKGTRWLREGVEYVVRDGIPGNRWFGDNDTTWRVVVDRADGLASTVAAISDLRPIPPKPKTASGEVVGTVKVFPDFSTAVRDRSEKGIPPGTYTIIKRETP